MGWAPLTAIRGGTLVELLVVVLVIGLLLGLLLPQNICGLYSMRRERCAHNSAVLAKAVFRRAEWKASPSLPGYLQAQGIVLNSSSADEYPTTDAKQITVAWPFPLLPELEQQAMRDAGASGEPKAYGLDIDHSPAFSILACPSDPQVDARYAAFSCVLYTSMP
jgi:competence protein ComGC